MNRIFVIAALLLSTFARAEEPFVLRGDDRVVLLGNALIEHEHHHGFLETRLLRHVPPGKTPIFRNLGWAGDTIKGQARSSGYQQPEGMGRLLKEVLALKPTVLFIGYGMNESFGGPAELPGFIKAYHKLLDDLAPAKARVVILSPTFHEDLGRPLPDPTAHNGNLDHYTAALEKLAKDRNAMFVDCFHPLQDAKAAHPNERLTSNGILLNETGYWHLSKTVVEGLKLSPTGWTQDWDASPNLPGKRSPSLVVVEKLRDAIVRRNEQFYRRWRPFNDHSRHWSFMAIDFKLYDEIIERQDREIDDLRRQALESLVPETKR